MYYIIGAFLFSLVISVILLPNILLISHKKSLFDKPDARKLHTSPVPRLGGISFFPVIFIVMLCSAILRFLLGDMILDVHDYSLFVQFGAFCIGCMLLYLVGVKDDLIGVGYKTKFATQILCGCLLALSGLWLDSLGGIKILGAIPAVIGVPLTVFLCVYITNAINLIDGIDGLASGLSVIALTTMGGLFFVGGELTYAILAFCGVGCLLPFFRMNVRRSPGSRKKLFMGDTGSLTLGYLLSFLFLNLCVNTSTFQPLESRYQYIAFGALIIPLFDVVRVVLVRLRLRQPPFLPDRNHIHHKLMRSGMNSTQVMVFLLLLSVFFIACNYLLTDYLYGSIVFFIDLGIWFVFHGILNFIISRRKAGKTTEDVKMHTKTINDVKYETIK